MRSPRRRRQSGRTAANEITEPVFRYFGALALQGIHKENRFPLNSQENENLADFTKITETAFR